MVTELGYREEFCEQLEGDPNSQWMGQMRDFTRLIFQDNKALKWTLPIACRGGVFKHSLNSYYPDARENLASTHMGVLLENGLLVEIKEDHLETIGWAEEVEFLRDRRDSETSTDLQRASELNLRQAISDVRIKEIVRTISDEDAAESVSLEDTVTTINRDEWIFLTVLGEETYQSLFGTGGSLRVVMELTNTRFPDFLQSLPKITQIGNNRWVPNPYRFVLDEPDIQVFDFEKSNRHNGLSRGEEKTIRDALLGPLRNCESATVFLPWIPDERILEQLNQGKTDYTVVFDKGVVNSYQQESHSRQLLSILFADDGDSEPLSNQLEKADNTYLATNARIPYLLIRTTNAETGELTLYAKGGLSYDPNRVLLSTQEEERDDSLYQWSEELVEDVTDEAKPFDQLIDA